jgi:hypothetical protein
LKVSGMATPNPIFEDWKSEVDRLMKSDYSIDCDLAGIDDGRLRSHWLDNQPLADFVIWFAEKYDLSPVKVWGWYRPAGL